MNYRYIDSPIGEILVGFGGGIETKRFLLELEERHRAQPVA